MTKHAVSLVTLAATFACVTGGWVRADEQTRDDHDIRKREFVYKRIGDIELKLQVYDSPKRNTKKPRAAIVFFFGGGWRAGSVKQFAEHSKHLARRGMVAVTADYRVSSRHHTKALHCVEDGKSAIRWVRAHASELNVDPERIAAGGGSAGGHVAAAVAIVPGFETAAEDQSVSYAPNALVLYNPALVLAPVDGTQPFAKNRMASLMRRMGTDPVKLSPYHHVRSGLPPTIIFHGEADQTVPLRTAKLFSTAMVKAGNDCTLKTYPKQPHGFFNYRNGKNPYYAKTVAEMDKFLESIGFLDND